MTRKYLLRLSWPPKALQSNSRAHWAVKARATKAYRQEAWAEACRYGLPMLLDARLTFEYYEPQPKRRRDPHNVAGAMKAAIDGIADAMGCDDAGFLCTFPQSFCGSTENGAILITVEEGE